MNFGVHLDLARGTLRARDNAKGRDSEEICWISPANDVEGIHEIRAQIELEPFVDGYGFSDFKRFRPLRKAANPVVVL